MRLMRRRTERTQFALQTYKQRLINELHRRRGVLHTPGLRRLCNISAEVCDMVHAVAYRAYATRPYKWRKTVIAHSFQNSRKIMSDVGKTT